METYTIEQLPNTATEVQNGDYLVIWQNGKTKKITGLNFMKSQKAKGGTFYFATMADFNTAKQIEEGQTGYIPDNSTIVIGELNNNLIGENVNVLQSRRRRK